MVSKSNIVSRTIKTAEAAEWREYTLGINLDDQGKACFIFIHSKTHPLFVLAFAAAGVFSCLVFDAIK